MDMHQQMTLRFSYNWNGKLNNKFFTTLRLKNDEKFPVGKEFMLEYKDKCFKIAKIYKIIDYKIDELPDLVCRFDTGYSAAESKTIFEKMYKDVNWETQLISCIVFETVKVYEQVESYLRTTK